MNIIRNVFLILEILLFLKKDLNWYLLTLRGHAVETWTPTAFDNYQNQISYLATSVTFDWDVLVVLFPLKESFKGQFVCQVFLGSGDNKGMHYKLWYICLST